MNMDIFEVAVAAYVAILIGIGALLGAGATLLLPFLWHHLSLHWIR